MSMTSRERVMLAFQHVEPDRVPTWCGSSPEFWESAKVRLGLDDEGLRLRLGDDFRRVSAGYKGDLTPRSPEATYRSPFGVDRKGIGFGQPLSHPLANASLQGVHGYLWPDPSDVDVSTIRAQALPYAGQYAILGGSWAPFWHDAIDLMGMENLLCKMYDDPQVVDAVLTHIVDFYFAESVRIFDEAADLIDISFIGNDFGSQQGPLVGEGLFRRFLLPQLKRLIDLGHDYGLKVQLHCCGGFRPLIPALIEAGLDAIHALQPHTRGMDPAELKRDFGHKILLNGCIDSQHVLIEGPSPGFVRARTREILRTMMPGGGYVAGPSHDYVLDETPLENVLAMYDTIREDGRYG
jgi:uroporphyrinogen decarboxylase